MASAFVMRCARRLMSSEAAAISATKTSSQTMTTSGRRRLSSKDLYLCDLSSSSQAHEIHHLFSRQGRVRSITMHFTPHGSFARTALVKFSTYEEAQLALEEHQRHGTMLNGVQIQVAPADTMSGMGSGPALGSRPVKQGPGSQIFVSNMSYTTTADQIRAAFSSFGSVLDVNLFKRDNQSLGMAKVLFARKADADAAITALNEVSFDGRTLFVKIDSNYVSTGDAVGQQGHQQQQSESAANSTIPETTASSQFDDDLMRSIDAAAKVPVDDGPDTSLDEAIRADNAALEREMERSPSA